jgi:hypothetical protein
MRDVTVVIIHYTRTRISAFKISPRRRKTHKSDPKLPLKHTYSLRFVPCARIWTYCGPV